MLTRIVSASVIALASTQAKNNWLQDVLGTRIEDHANHLLEKINQVDDSLHEMHVNLKKLHQSIQNDETEAFIDDQLQRDPDFSKTF